MCSFVIFSPVPRFIGFSFSTSFRLNSTLAVNESMVFSYTSNTACNVSLVLGYKHPVYDINQAFAVLTGTSQSVSSPNGVIIRLFACLIQLLSFFFLACVCFNSGFGLLLHAKE